METKRILISLDEPLLSEIDGFAKSEGVTRSSFIRKALSKEVRLKKGKLKEAEMKKGYLAMGNINLELANQGIIADNEQFLTYEQKLSERE